MESTIEEGDYIAEKEDNNGYIVQIAILLVFAITIMVYSISSYFMNYIYSIIITSTCMSLSLLLVFNMITDDEMNLESKNYTHKFDSIKSLNSVHHYAEGNYFEDILYVSVYYLIFSTPYLFFLGDFSVVPLQILINAIVYTIVIIVFLPFFVPITDIHLDKEGDIVFEPYPGRQYNIPHNKIENIETSDKLPILRIRTEEDTYKFYTSEAEKIQDTMVSKRI